MATPLRKQHPMPEIAAFVASLREAFGDASIDEAIARGRRGEPGFYASENGRTVGVRTADGLPWQVDQSLANRRFCAGCEGQCVGSGLSCSQIRSRGGAKTLAPGEDGRAGPRSR